MKKKKILILNYEITLIFLIISFGSVFSQTTKKNFIIKDSIYKLIQNRELEKVKLYIDSNKNKYSNKNDKYLLIDSNEFYYFYLKKNFLCCKKVLDKIENYKNELNQNNLNDFYVNKGFFYKEINKLDSAATYFTKSLSFFSTKNDNQDYSAKLSNIYQGLANIYRLSNNSEKHLKYLKKYLEEALKSKNEYKISSAYNKLGVFYDRNNQPEKAIKNFKISLKLKQRIESKNTILQNIGSIYLHHYNNIDSATYYNKKAINKKTTKRNLAFIYNDLALIERKKGKLKKENYYLNLALKNILEDKFQEHEIKLYKLLHTNNKALKQFDKSLFFFEKYDSLNEIIKNQKLLEKVEEIETKYQTEKKEKENLQLKSENQTIEAKRKQNFNLLITSIVLFILGLIIYLLTLNNSKKKRKLAEQRKELEVQKNFTLLKEQEVLAINAMVSGQEKERKRIAEDLHDNIGSVLATLKLHFENLKLNREKKHFNQEDLYTKTEELIDETYTKIRKIAHTENAGTIGNKGLLVAMKLMTEKIALLNNMNIEVIDFGLDKPLENDLELTLFRISQELVTNILKHAKAKNIHMNISQFEDHFSLIVEDDGVGFNLKKTDLKNSMGLSSIKTRVNHLGGKLKIDSTIGKGTSILITIPLQ